MSTKIDVMSKQQETFMTRAEIHDLKKRLIEVMSNIHGQERVLYDDLMYMVEYTLVMKDVMKKLRNISEGHL